MVVVSVTTGHTSAVTKCLLARCGPCSKPPPKLLVIDDLGAHRQKLGNAFYDGLKYS
jgi:hypothetical protein